MLNMHVHCPLWILPVYPCAREFYLFLKCNIPLAFHQHDNELVHSQYSCNVRNNLNTLSLEGFSSFFKTFGVNAYDPVCYVDNGHVNSHQ